MMITERSLSDDECEKHTRSDEVEINIWVFDSLNSRLVHREEEDLNDEGSRVDRDKHSCMYYLIVSPSL